MFDVHQFSGQMKWTERKKKSKSFQAGLLIPFEKLGYGNSIPASAGVIAIKSC
tara:strand:+ start:5340 stop:5498 length:159 start_codon:yes stop_codon:yes gene_type:complete